jgi:hypothetical protein
MNNAPEQASLFPAMQDFALACPIVNPSARMRGTLSGKTLA